MNMFSAHPFLFALYPIFHLFTLNIGEAYALEMAVPALVALVATTALFGIFWVFFRNINKAAFVTSLFTIVFFSYGPLCTIIEHGATQFYGTLCGGQSNLVAILLGALVASFIAVAFQKSDLRNATRGAFVAGVVLLILSVIAMGTALLQQNQDLDGDDLVLRAILEQARGALKKSSVQKPDIYYFVFDRYGSEDVLREFYDMDNREFLGFLESRGFYVASKSNANYLKTAHSLASLLNMEYINYLEEEMGSGSGSWKPLYRMLQDYRVWRFLKAQGYTYYHFGSWWQPTSRNVNADENINILALPEFSQALFSSTVAYPVSIMFGLYDKRFEQWERVRYQFEKLKEVPERPGPAFVFAHMTIPHPPYIIDEDGSFLSYKKMMASSVQDLYRNQVLFVNGKVEEFIDHILAASEVAPIIVISSDEGPFPYRYAVATRTFDWSKEGTNEEFMEKFGILNAYYLPGVDEAKFLYQTITPVNSFRIIFNVYFGTNLALLEDKSYAFRNDLYPYSFFSVTDRLQNLSHSR